MKYWANFMADSSQANKDPKTQLQEISQKKLKKLPEYKLIKKIGPSHFPKFTVMINGSFGAGNYGMCGRAFDGRFVFSWPNHQIGIMGAEQAASTLVDVKVRQLERAGQELTDQEVEDIKRPILESYEKELSAYYATSHLWDDGIIDPVDTRNALGISLSASLNAPINETTYGVLRL